MDITHIRWRMIQKGQRYPLTNCPRGRLHCTSLGCLAPTIHYHSTMPFDTPCIEGYMYNLKPTADSEVGNGMDDDLVEFI